jgi:hypothetical protein
MSKEMMFTSLIETATALRAKRKRAPWRAATTGQGARVSTASANFWQRGEMGKRTTVSSTGDNSPTHEL